jgi:ribose transport system substrate-binding protein
MVAAAGAVVAGMAGLTSISSPAYAAGKTYTIYLSNNFAGNDWRQQMLRSAQLATEKGPLAGRVILKIENTENTIQAQTASLNNIIRAKPNAILIDAGSDTALNPVIKRACNEGIVVVSFDQPVTAPCAYKVAADWPWIARITAEWLAKILNGKGEILMDRGLAGAPNATTFVDGYEEVLKKYPNIKVIGYFNGNYAIGPEQAGVASQLAAHPHVDGVLTQGYGTGAIKAEQDAGRSVVPVTAVSYNGTAVTCAQTAGAKCILGVNPSWISAEALRVAVDVLDGKAPASKELPFRAPFLTTDPIKSDISPDTRFEKIVLGVNAYPDLPPGMTLPISPDWMTITPKEASGD